MKQRCPNCGTSVTFGDESGSTSTCPRCRATLRIHIIKDESTGWEWPSAILKMQFAIHLMLMFGVAWMIGSSPHGPADGSAVTALGLVLGIAYLICLCCNGAIPDSAARRYALASVMTLVFGTIGWYAATAWIFVNGRGLTFPLEAAIGLTGFSVYFAAFVLLVRYHASIAAAFGNRRLWRECHVFLAAPVVAVVAVVAMEIVRNRSRFASPYLFEKAELAVSFGVFVWYAMIVLRTFRTIDGNKA